MSVGFPSTAKRPFIYLALLAWAVLIIPVWTAQAQTLNATFNTATDVPVTASGYTASGTVNFTLNCALPTGTNLTVVNNTSLGFISGTFSNLAQGQAVTLSFGGFNYNFVANYYGGTGNDLVLQWASVRPMAWGLDTYGQLGNGSTTTQYAPVAVTSTGVLSGKTIIGASAGGQHTLALCSDGTVAAWGYDTDGELGNGGNSSSSVPVTVTSTGVLANHTVITVSAGYRHSLALCSDGTVASWGSNTYGQLGNNTTTSSNVPVLVNEPWTSKGVTAVNISAGGSHNLVLCSDGSVYAWGYNSDGQLGNNSYVNSSVPVLIGTAGTALAGKVVVAISAGATHNVVLCADGSLAAWGYGYDGELGNPTAATSPVPVAVSTSQTALANETVVAVCVGTAFSVALCADGTMATWESGGYGQLGDSLTTTNSTAAVSVSTSGVLAGKSGVSISVGASHVLALCSDGTLTAWGQDAFAQLGNGSSTNALVPVDVTNNLAAGEVFMKVASGQSADHSVAIVAEPPKPQIAVQQPAGTGLANGGTVSFGNSPVGTGAPLTFTIQSSGTAPLAISAVTMDGIDPGDFTVTTPPASSVAAGANTTLVVTFTPAGTFDRTAAMHIASNDPATASFNVQLVGNSSGTLAATYNSATDVPVTAAGCTVSGSSVNFTLNFAPIAGATLTVINNTSLNFIQGSFSNLTQGQLVTLTYGGINYDFVANYYGGTGNDLVLQWANNHTAAWGYNATGQLGDGTLTNRGLPVTVIPNTLLYNKTVIAVAAGGGHSLALCSDGTVGAWGEDIYGQLGNGFNTSQLTSPVAVTTSGTALAGKTVIAVSAGNSHSLALCSDGTVAAWGNDANGQLGNNSTAYSVVAVAVVNTGALLGKTVVAISAGGNHSLALCSDGTVAAWGAGSSGQLGNSATSDSSVPVKVYALGALFGKTVIAIAAGGNHSLALCSDGTVVSWGLGSSGQLGNNNNLSYLAPVPVTVGGTALSGKTVIAIAAGSTHSLALCSDGTVAAWGSNIYGQLGNSIPGSSEVPSAVTTAGTPLAGRTMVSIAAGTLHSTAACSDGTQVSWGSGVTGQFGNGQYPSNSLALAMGSAGLAPGELVMQATTCQSAFHDVGLIAEPPYPVAITQAASAITTTTATLNSQVDPDGNNTTGILQWGLTTSYGSSTINVPMGSGAHPAFLLTNLTGLAPHSTYHYRVTASNAAGAANGADVSFTTLDTPPIANADTVNNVSGPVTIPVLNNDTDADGDSLAITAVTEGANGSATTNGTTVTYTPGTGFASAASDTFSYTISDGFGGTATGTVSVYAPGIQGWRAQTFGANATNSAISGDNADPNGNGIPNLMEYALHGDAVGNSTGASILPQASSNPNTGVMQLSFTRYQDRTDITLIVQACDSLTGTWTNLAQSVDGAPFTVITTGATVNESGTGNAISVTAGDLYQMTDPNHPQRFMRLMVTRP